MPALKDVRRERFCQEVAHGKSHAQAYLAAGFSGDPKRAAKNGESMVRESKWAKVRIDEIRREALEKAESAMWLNQKYVLAESEELWKRLMQKKPVLDRQGNETGEWKFEASAAVKLHQLRGLQVGLYNPEKKSRHGKLDPLENMDEAQLTQFIGRSLKELGPGALEELGLVAIEPTSGDGEEAVELTNSPAGPLQTTH